MFSKASDQTATCKSSMERPVDIKNKDVNWHITWNLKLNRDLRLMYKCVSIHPHIFGFQ